MTDGPIARAIAGAPAIGDEMFALAERLYPLQRSLTGDGLRETLRILGEKLPLDVTEVPSGTQVYDWTVPQEWNIRGAWIDDPSGQRIVDLADHPLHVVGYSVPVRERMSGSELLEHVHWLPEHPDWIPARTSYYAPAWGFCLTGPQRDAIRPEAEYEVTIDSTLADGALTYGELVVPGRSEDEALLSTYICHAGLADDNLSGIVVLEALGRLLPREGLRYTYRFLFAPTTIGALTWLSRNEDSLGRVQHGLIVSCVGDTGPVRFKRSRSGDTDLDRAAAHVVSRRPGGSAHPFVPWGGDERQFCSPGFDLPVGSLTRTEHGQYPEYHTSADDLSFIGPAELADSLATLVEILDVLERDRVLARTNPYGEPQLGRRGLYEQIGAGVAQTVEESRQALLWVLNAADGTTSLIDLATRANLPFGLVADTADLLEAAGLVREVTD
jgi:aminopeptidase-like protein